MARKLASLTQARVDLAVDFTASDDTLPCLATVCSQSHGECSATPFPVILRI